jgi:predicted dehydrogenase
VSVAGTRNRVAFIGAGRVADVHHLAISELDAVELVGLTDVDHDKATSKAREWGVRVYADTDEVLADATVEAVLVLTHLDTHLSLARRAIEAGKHVLIEKPVGSDPGEIRAVADLAADRGRVVMPGHNYAYVPEYRRIQRLVANGDLGTVRALFITYVIPHPEELAAKYAGVIEEVMVHHSYLTTALLGPPDRIAASTSTPGWEHHTAEDQAWMAWDYASGATAQLFCSFAMEDVSHCPATFMVKVLGTEGSAVMDWRTAVFSRPLATLPYAIVAYEESYGHELAAFAAAMQGTPAVASTMEDSAQAAAIISAAYRSASSLRSVSRQEGGW